MSIQSNQLLVRAAKIGDVECVKILLPVSEPRAHCSRALLMAVARDQQSCVDVLFDHSEVHRVLKILRAENFPFNPTYEAFECRVLRMVLEHNIETVGCAKRRML